MHRKLEDIRTSKPDYALAGTKGGTLTKTVVQDFWANPDHMLAIAAEIRRGLEAHEFDDLTRSAIDNDDLSDAPEGALLEARALRRERDRSLRQRKIEAARRAGQPIGCEVCLFDFEAAYGTRGRGYVEIHHAVPLHVSGPVMTSLDGLVLHCSNCHRMVHRGPGWLSVDGLKSWVARAGGDRDDEASAFR